MKKSHSKIATSQADTPKIIEAKNWVIQAIRDTTSHTIGVVGGLGSGKSHGAKQWLYDRMALNWRAERCWYVINTHRLIESAVIPSFRKVLQQIGFQEGVHFRIKESAPAQIVMCTGQVVDLLSAQRPQDFVAAEIHTAVIDEAGSLKREVYEGVMTRLRDVAAQSIQCMVVGAPQGVDNWFADLFNRPYTAIQRDNMRIHRISTVQNQKYLPAHYIESLRRTYGHNPQMLESYLKGYFVPFYVGNAFANFSEDDLIDFDVMQFNPARPLDMCWDFNRLPLAWVVGQVLPIEHGLSRKERFVVSGESDGTSSQLEEGIGEFILMFPPDRYRDTEINLYGDRSGHSGSHKTPDSDYEKIQAELKKYYNSVNVIAVRRVIPQVDSVESTNRAFSYSQILISRKNVNLIKSLRGTRWQEGKRELFKPANDKITHWADALKYRIYQLYAFEGGLNQGAKILGKN